MPILPVAASRRWTSGPVTAACVTSSPIIVTSTSAAKTSAAASGSAQMLNSAAGVMLPSAIAPPMTTICASPSVPWRSRYRATFVSGPVGTSVTGRGAEATAAAIQPTASVETGSVLACGSAGPSRPLSPWTCAATTSSRSSGASAPEATATSVRPASSSTRRAFAVVFSSVWFPYVVVTPRSSSSGLASARRSAIASS